MKYFMAGLFLLSPVFMLAFTTTHKPDFDGAHGAFVCNYLGTVCRDKASVLPVAWRRYALQ
jgi:hypothetical protein